MSDPVDPGFGGPSGEEDLDDGPVSSPIPVGVPLTDRRDLWWLNWTSIRGVALVLAGVTIVVTPQEQKTLVVVVGALLVGWAVSELWFAVIRSRRPSEYVEGVTGTDSGTVWVGRILMGAFLLVAAGLMLFERVDLSVVIGVVILLRAAVMVGRSVRAPRGRRRDHVLTAVLLTVIGVVIIIVPDTAVLALRAGIGVGAMALGGVMLSMGLRRGDTEFRQRFDHSSAPALVNDWLIRRRLGPDDRGPLVETLFFEPPNRTAKLASFWVMMVLATGIASFAVIQDSTAVVIGAMLVAPLMTPIMGVSAAAVNGWAARLARSITLVAVAALAAVFIAWLIASWLPSVGQIATNTQISSRVEPSLLDFCIAVFAGAAGAYATVDPRVSSSLSGVAIAVALVPPLSVVGITLEAGSYDWALGALLLFTTNVVSIVLAAVTVFVLMGFAALPPSADQRARLRRVVAVFGIGALIILVPLSFTSEDLWTEAFDQGETEEEVAHWLPEDGSVELVRVETEGKDIEIVLTGPELPGNTDQLLSDLTERLGFEPTVTLRLVPAEVTELN